MPSLSLKIVLDEGAVTRKVKFNTNMTVKQALAVVKDKVIVPDKGKEYALFLRSADDDMTGVWLEDDRTLDYYMLRDGDSLDYICRIRTLRVKLLDDTVKTLQVDEAKTVGELMMSICARIGITNYDEYGLCHEEEEETEEAKEVKEGTGTLTLKRKQAKQERDAALEQLSKKLKTDDNVEWLDLHRSLREQGIDPKETLLLKRRLYYSDRNVDSRDPVQLHLLYVQTRDTILNGTHPVTEQQAVQFAGIQCQVQLGDYQEKKHKPGFIENFEEYLPAQYLNAWNIEKKIVKEFSQHQGLSELEAKFLYIKTARSLPTYGVTFFLVKEKQKDKKKLVPRLLGINSHAILRLDEVTKEILQEWPLTHVKTYHAGKSQTFTLNFGDYSDKEYSVKTQDCHRIRDILEGYIDIIRRRMLAKPSRDPGESMAICHDNIQQGTSHLIQHVSNNPSKIVTETFVGPNKLMTSEHGSQPQSGTMITTVQQLVVTDHLQNQQMALKGEMPLRTDMSKDCIKKLNKMNSNSVKIVGLLTDPTEHDYEEIQKIVRAMKEDFPDIDKGVKETADKQAIEDAKRMLLDELHDLNNFMNKLDAATASGHFDREGAKDAAENIADLTTQVYFSLDPKTRRRSELIRRSRNKMKAGEKSEQSLRRASFLAAANSAQHALNSAVETLNEDYTGPKPDAAQRMQLEKALEDKMGKLNAAIALYLTAHSDPENIDYASAINSMNAINELMPEIAKDTQILASTLEPSSREQLLDDMQELCDATRAVCGTISAEDHAKMQEATNQYAGIAGKLISTFARGSNADKEHEIIELAKDVGAKTSLLLVSTNELTCQAASEPAAADVDTAGVRVAEAATDLIACAQLTAPAIHEPHCQSALTAACEGIGSSVHQLETAWRPLLEDQTRQPMNDQLHSRVVDVGKALERLKDAYANLGGVDDDDSSLPAQERKRLKFIATMNGAKGRLQGVEDLWNQQSATGVPSDVEKAEAQRRMEQSMAQLNAAIAALAAATADRENPDYETAELAIATISELMPQIVQDAETVSSDKDEATRNAMQKNIRALCDATRKICEGDGCKHVDGEEAANFAAASGKLLFLISPGADKGRQKFIMEESAIAQEHAAQLVAGAHRLQTQVPEHTAAELASRAARTADAANALGAVAQVTAPSISSPRCQDALSSAASQLLGSADSLTAVCQLQAHEQPELQAQCAGLADTHLQLADSLHRLTDACNVGQGDTSMTEPSAQQEKKRLQFVKSTAAAKQRLDAAAQQLNKPLRCHMMEEGHAAALGQKLNDRIAQLNAAVAALAAATSDRENPDYEAAERAVNAISQIMPHLIQDSQMLCGTKSDAEQAAMLQELRALCEATQELCDNAGQPQGVGDAIAKYTDASTKLVYCATPRADNEMENEILGLTTDACGKASELLSQVQQLTERVADAGAAAELDRCGASAADAAQALLTVAQATASTMDSPCCKDQLISAAQKLRRCADELTSSCEPHTARLPDARRQLGTSHRQLADSLDKLVQACQKIPEGSQSGVSQPPKEKQRLKFMNSLTGARNRLYDAEQQLKQPLPKHQLSPEQAAALEQRLSQRLAQLNAAVAALAAAKADPENPDWKTAEQSVKEISELMPLIVQDSRQLSSTKDGAGQAAMLDDLKALCHASRSLCENSETDPKISTKEFHKAASKLKFIVSPTADKIKEKQVVELATAACKQAERLAVNAQTACPAQAPLASSLHEAAGTLDSVVQATSASPSDPRCCAAVNSSVDNVRHCAQQLTSSCEPPLMTRPEVWQQLLSCQRQLTNDLDKLVQAYQPEHGGTIGTGSGQQEQQRLKFINSASGAKGRLNATEQLLKEPLVCQLMKEEDGAALQRRLGARVAQLNAAVAALTAATADREHPDYAAADQAIQHIAQLMPQVVQESRTLCGTKSDAEQAAMLQELRALCEATQELCEHAGQAQGVSDAAAKFSAASGKLVYVVSPKTQDAHEKQVLALAATSCGKASELLSQVQQLTERVTDAGAAAELDRCGASAADAAQALLTVAQTTAPTISDPQCQRQVMSSAQKLRRCADELIATCEPHTAQLPDVRRQLGSSHRQLDDSLANLVQACVSVPHGDASSGQQEQQRLKFINSASGAKGRLNATEQLLKEPLVCQLMKEEDGAALQRRLGARVAQLNAAVAALTAATADREHPDYAAADQAIQHIAQLMPQVVQESRTLCGTKSDAEQAAMLQELRALCEATQELCEHAGQAQGVSDAAAKFSAASGKLVYVVSPKTQDAHEKQVLTLAATSCGKASELLSQVQQLTDRMTDAGAAAELDRCGASAADAAQALLTVAQTTAPTISDPQCQKQVISSAQKLRRCADGLIATCEPHTAQLPDVRRQLGSSHRQLDDSLDKLVQVCHSASGVVLSPQQEQQRLKFVSSISGTQSKLDTAEQQMKKPVVVQPLQQADSAALQQQLSRRLAQLNAAIAALAAATTDGKNPDYPAAERAVTTVIELMPEIVQDSYKICSTKEPAEQAAMMQELRELCETSRIICDSAGHPIKLNEATARLADASSKLLHIVSPDGKHPGDANRGSKPAVQPRKPAVPVRDPKHTVAKAVHSGQAPDAQSFLDAMRAEESGGHIGGHVKSSKTAEEEKLAHKQFSEMIENAERGLKSAEEGLQVLYKAKNVTIAGQTLPALEVVKREQHMEDTLAKAGIEVAALVSANYADKLDYKAAMQPTLSLTESVRSVVNDGSAICTSMSDEARKKFLEDMIGLCQSTKILCDTAKSEKEKLNDAAIVFGDQSVKLLRVVSCNVDPALEKEAISRAKAIGDAASRLALEATSLASSTSEANNPGTADSLVRDICAAGTSCVDSAGKLVYTAKLIAPTIHHETCQDALVSSADSLSSSLTTFTNTLAPLASTQHPNVQKLLGEAGHLEKLVEKLRKDVRAGKLGKRKEVDPVVDLDFPLRNLTQKIIDNAKNMVRDETMSSQTKKEYTSYCGKLEEALRVLDLANARYQRAPHDINKRDEFEMTIDELQMTVLQSRPAKAGQEQNNIVDFRDFLQDLVNEAGDLQKTVRKNEGPIGKRTSEDITMLCSKISEDASKLLNPNDNFGQSVTVMNTVDDILDIDLFGQECDTLVKEINNSIQGVQDQKTKQELLAKSLPMLESCHLLRFAAKSHIMATQSTAYNEIMQNLDHFKSTTMSTLAEEAAKKSVKQTKSYASTLGSQCCLARASSRLVGAGQRAARGEPHELVRAVTHYAVSSAAETPAMAMAQEYQAPKVMEQVEQVPKNFTLKEQVEEVPEELEEHVVKENIYRANLSSIVDWTDRITSACKMSMRIAAYEPNPKANKCLKELNELDYKLYPRKVSTQVLNSDDIDRLLICPRETVEGTPKQLEEKLQQLSSKLSSMGSTVVLSVSTPSSLARSLHAAAQAAVQLANTARALADRKRPAQCKLIEDAAHEMCLSTYSLMKTSELVCQEPNHHDSKRKLLEACRHLNDSINKLVRSTGTGQKTSVGRACGEAGRSLALHRGMLQAAPRPPAASSYALSVHTMQSQRDVLQKLNSDEAMSREEFLKSMNYAVTAVNNSAECAAQAAYLISVSDQDKSIGLKGPVDVGKLQKAIQAVEDTCISIITTNDDIQVAEEKKILKSQMKDLEDTMKDAVEKTKEGELKEMLKECTNDLLNSHHRLEEAIEYEFENKVVITSKVTDLMHDVSNVSSLVEHPDLVPVATEISADTQKHVDEIVKNSLTLLSNTEELVKQVKAAPEEPETMKWVMFNKRKDVLDAFENLLRSVKASGQRVNLLEAAVEEPEEDKKSYVETQFDLASKWLSKPMCKPEVKSKGQEAVRNLVDVANKVAEDLQGSDKEDMKNLIVETEQLLKECSQKYDQEQYSVLLERVRELKKGVSRGVVSKLVQDFMQAEEPLADLDLIAEYEQDESKRKFMLEKKIAELLAQLGRVTGTARLVAHTHAHRADDIHHCSQQTELLAPMLVKAAQERIARPDDKAVIENYKSLLAKYAESMSKIRDLCDQSVDPMEFVQTAGETIERMREESSTQNDPLHNAHTSTAISKLADRVIHVGMSSSTARRDPELQRALAAAQHQLAAATPAPDTRASKMPDFKDTTARILQATEEVESLLCGETIFKQQPTQNQPIFNEAMNLHVAIRDWSSRDNEIVAVAKRMAVLMAKLSNFMNNDKQREVLATSKSIVLESHEVARLAKKLAHECTDHRIKTNLLQTCERIPTISGQLKMLTTVKGFSLGRHGTQEDKEAMDMLVGNAQSLMLSIQDVVKGAASASVKIMSQRGPRMKWVRKTVY